MLRITSRDNTRLKEVARLLASARERRKTGRCVLEGVHLVRAYLASGREPEWLVVDDAALAQPEIAAFIATTPGARVLAVASPLYAETAHLASPAPIMAVVAVPRPRRQRPGSFALLLEDLQDPGNVGTILRSAAAAGVQTVHLSHNSAFAWSPKVLRAGQGAHFGLEIFEDVDLVGLADAYPGRVVAAVLGRATAIYDVDLRGAVAIAVGSEGAGLSAPLRAAADVQATIPMPGGFESLNAAVAASICLFEKVRQDRG